MNIFDLYSYCVSSCLISVSLYFSVGHFRVDTSIKKHYSRSPLNFLSSKRATKSSGLFIVEIFDIYPASILETLRKQPLFKKVCGPWKGSLIQTCSRPSGSCWSLAFDCTLPALEATASPVQHGIHLAEHSHLRWEWNALFLSETHSLQAQRGNFSNGCLNRLLALLSLSVACVQMTEFRSKMYYWMGLKMEREAYVKNCIRVSLLCWNM